MTAINDRINELTIAMNTKLTTNVWFKVVRNCSDSVTRYQNRKVTRAKIIALLAKPLLISFAFRRARNADVRTTYPADVPALEKRQLTLP